MGLFGSKKVTTVGTTVSRVIDDGALPNAIRTGVLQTYLGQPPQDLTQNILEHAISSIGVRAERMYTYAKDHYIHGLPSGSAHLAIQGRDETQAILDQIEGQSVLIDYYQYGPPNALHIGWIKLLAEHGWNPETNELPALSTSIGKTVYLEDMVIVVPSIAEMEPEAIAQWGRPPRAGKRPGRNYSAAIGNMLAHTPIHEDPQVSEEHILVKYCWQDIGYIGEGDNQTIGTVLHIDSFTISLSGYNEQADYAHAKYSVNGVVKYWIYRIGSGTYPILDTVHDQPVTTGSFFPFAYFRYEKKSEIEDTSTEAYKTSKKLVKYLGMDYDSVAEAIDENPDIANVEQAMLTLAIPANTEHALERRYLYQFFDNWFSASGAQFSSNTESAIQRHFSMNPDLTKNSIVIQDKRFKMALHNAGIYKKRVAGSIGDTGSYDSGITETNIAITYLVVVDDNGTTQEQVQTVPVKTHYYRYQNSEATYDEIQVVGLKMLYHVFGQYTVTADDDDDILLIPIDRSITEEFSIPEREILYSRGLHFVFNSVVVTSVKWYQTGFFQFVMIVVAVVITVVSMGSSVSTLAAAIASGSAAAIAAAAWILLQDILWGLVISYAFKLFAEVVGVRIALIIALVAVLYGGAVALQNGSVKGAPWAEELLTLGTGLAKGTQAYTEDLIGSLIGEANEFQKYMEEQTKLLDSANELLENNSLISPFIIYGESPDDYYNRTIHSGNIGVLGLDAISSYVDSALTLPKLHETIGNNLNDS